MAGNIPTLKEIRSRFQRDVTLPAWRHPLKGAPSSPLQLDASQAELEDHFRRLAAELEKQNSRARERIRTRDDLLRHGRKARRQFLRMQGLLPLPQKTPLRPSVKRAFETDAYTVDLVVFESRPSFYVTGNLYLPIGRTGPFPAVLHVCGHSPNGKAYENYQTLCAALARKGLAVLSIDPAGQGERDEYTDTGSGKRTVVRACRMHAAAGTPMYLLDSNFGAIRLWDAIRALDYLEGRPDIRKSRIGVTGTSGGGWESMWLAAIDRRVKAVHSSCYMTSMSQRIANRIADAEPDPEQDPFRFLSTGVDTTDLVLACAPRAVALGVTTRDYFPIAGARKCHAEARRIFRRADLEDRLSMKVADWGHGMDPAMRQHCIGWMLRWLDGQSNSDVSEETGKPEPESRLTCTETGVVLSSLGGRSSAEFTALDARKLAKERPRLATRDAFVRRARQTRAWLRNQLACEVGDRPIRMRVDDDRRKLGCRITPVTFGAPKTPWARGEVWRCTGRDDGRPVVLVGRCEAEKMAEREELCAMLAENGMPVLDLILRGQSDREPTWHDFIPLEDAVLASDALVIGRPLPGFHVRDVIDTFCVFSELLPRPVNKISVIGSGYGALIGLLAACLDRRIERLYERRPMTDYASLACHREYAWPLKFILPGILQHGDLPDIRATLAPRPLFIDSPRDHLGQPFGAQAALAALGVTRRGYQAHKQNSSLTIHTGPPGDASERVVRFFLSS